jgi:hypothetical protein
VAAVRGRPGDLLVEHKRSSRIVTRCARSTTRKFHHEDTKATKQGRECAAREALPTAIFIVFVIFVSSW